MDLIFRHEWKEKSEFRSRAFKSKRDSVSMPGVIFITIADSNSYV